LKYQANEDVDAIIDRRFGETVVENDTFDSDPRSNQQRTRPLRKGRLEFAVFLFDDFH
jgi:hypothetical protein